MSIVKHSDGSVLSVLDRYGIPVPAVCIDPSGKPDLHVKTAIISLSNTHWEEPVFPGYSKGNGNNTTLKIVAIVCEECSVHRGSEPVYIDSDGGGSCAATAESAASSSSSLLPWHIVQGDEGFVDVFLPGLNVQTVQRIWVRPAAYSSLLQQHCPDLLRDRGDPKRGVLKSINARGFVEYSVSFAELLVDTHAKPKLHGRESAVVAPEEAEGGGGNEDSESKQLEEERGIYCPLGLFAHIWFTKVAPGQSAPREQQVMCPDHRHRLGYVLGDANAKKLASMLDSYRKDPRLEVVPETFRLRGRCVDPKWAVSMRLSIIFSTHT